MKRRFSAVARATSDFTASPAATIVAFALVVLWAATGPAFRYSEDWQLVVNTGTSVVTFLMVFLLQNAQARDTAAMNAKLDTIIRAIPEADDRLVAVEKNDDPDRCDPTKDY